MKWLEYRSQIDSNVQQQQKQWFYLLYARRRSCAQNMRSERKSKKRKNRHWINTCYWEWSSLLHFSTLSIFRLFRSNNGMWRSNLDYKRWLTFVNLSFVRCEITRTLHPPVSVISDCISSSLGAYFSPYRFLAANAFFCIFAARMNQWLPCNGDVYNETKSRTKEEWTRSGLLFGWTFVHSFWLKMFRFSFQFILNNWCSVDLVCPS